MVLNNRKSRPFVGKILGRSGRESYIWRALTVEKQLIQATQTTYNVFTPIISCSTLLGYNWNTK